LITVVIEITIVHDVAVAGNKVHIQAFFD